MSTASSVSTTRPREIRKVKFYSTSLYPTSFSSGMSTASSVSTSRPREIRKVKFHSTSLYPTSFSSGMSTASSVSTSRPREIRKVKFYSCINISNLFQGSHRLEKYLNIQDCLEN